MQHDWRQMQSSKLAMLELLASEVACCVGWNCCSLSFVSLPIKVVFPALSKPCGGLSIQGNAVAKVPLCLYKAVCLPQGSRVRKFQVCKGSSPETRFWRSCCTGQSC